MLLLESRSSGRNSETRVRDLVLGAHFDERGYRAASSEKKTRNVARKAGGHTCHTGRQSTFDPALLAIGRLPFWHQTHKARKIRNRSAFYHVRLASAKQLAQEDSDVTVLRVLHESATQPINIFKLSFIFLAKALEVRRCTRNNHR